MEKREDKKKAAIRERVKRHTIGGIQKRRTKELQRGIKRIKREREDKW